MAVCDMKNRSYLQLKAMLSEFSEKFASSTAPVHGFKDPVLSIDHMDRDEDIPLFLCDGVVNLPLYSREDKIPDVWKSSGIVFSAWDFFIGMNKQGLVTCIIVREGAEYFDRLKEVLTLLQPDEQVSVWESGFDNCGSLLSLKGFAVTAGT